MDLNDNIDLSEIEPSLSDLFSGKYSIADGLRQLRTRLLDLTSRNRLLNFKHPKGKSIQIVDADFDAVYLRLLDNRSLIFQPVPEPDQDQYTGQQPEVKQYAQSIGINTNIELSSPRKDLPAPQHGTMKLKALYYPEDLEKLLRKIAREAKTAIEETGTNMLYLVFGFLEFYETQNAERPLNAPLLAIPVALQRGQIDPVTRFYQYELSYTGEDITENLTLREKLKQEFSLDLPDLAEDETPESYIDRIRGIVIAKPRWKAKRQISLAMLSFSKLAMWVDLGNPGIPRHPIIRQIFEGNAEDDVSGRADDYKIDEHPNSDIPLIFDADTSQHSAIIDVMAGKNLVINGPPGTGKSQTITNIIAATIALGKSVLFVSEKLAALEVVRKRLDMAGLGDFCLELHSHKTQKKKLLEELRARMSKSYAQPPNLQNKKVSLSRNRDHLKRYADLMNAKVGNRLGMTVHDILWRAECKRIELGQYVDVLKDIVIPEAPNSATEELDEKREIVERLDLHFEHIGTFDNSHPWFGFYPKSIKPGDDLKIQRLLQEIIVCAKEIQDTCLEFQEYAGKLEQKYSREFFETLLADLGHLPNPDPKIFGELLPLLFPDSDPEGRQTGVVLKEFERSVEAAKRLINFSKENLLTPSQVFSEHFQFAKALMEELKGLGLQTSGIDTIGEISAGINQLLPKVYDALTWLRECGGLAGLDFEGTGQDIAKISAVINIAQGAPVDLLDYRTASLANVDARDKLAKAKGHFDKAHSQRESLSNIFSLEELPDRAEIQ